MLISIANNWLNAQTDHNDFLRNIIDGYLNQPLPKNPMERRVWRFIKDVKPLLLSGNHDDILLSIEKFNDIITGLRTEKRQVKFKGYIQNIFNYNDFLEKKSRAHNWDAYKLCHRSIARMCPYCHQAYAFTIQPGGRKNRGYRPTLDHFYDKGSYPHLALVLYNLVPSCYSCNSSLKHSRDFFAKAHLHPLFDKESIKLSLALADEDSSLSLLADLVALPAEKLKIVASPLDGVEKAESSIETFLIDYRYDSVKEEALAFALLKRELDLNADNFSGTDLGKNLREKRYLRFDRANYQTQMLGKLFADIYDLC